MGRTGYEPTQARSPLRLRLGLAVFGLVWGIAAAIGFSIAAQPAWSGICAFIAAVAAVDALVVIHRIHQGPRFQPGRDIPPYAPPRRPYGHGHGHGHGGY